MQILRRGNLLAVSAKRRARTEAAEVLSALYARLEAGRAVEPGDIDRESGWRPDEPAQPADGDQLEMFQGGRVEIKTRKKLVEPRTDAQKAYVRALFQNELAFGIGPAGTGKTYLAVAVGVNMFIDGHVDRIILSRPAVEAGERLGFLPGDMKEKVDPYMQPLYDALNDFLPGKQLPKLMRGEADRDRAAGLHARPHAVQRLRRAGRGAERHHDADEDVPDPPGRRVAAW